MKGEDDTHERKNCYRKYVSNCHLSSIHVTERLFLDGAEVMEFTNYPNRKTYTNLYR